MALKPSEGVSGKGRNIKMIPSRVEPSEGPDRADLSKVPEAADSATRIADNRREQRPRVVAALLLSIMGT
jgi:hypothetical protein